MSEILVPVYEQYTMTIKEASCYFRIERTSCAVWQRKIPMHRGT